MFNSVISETVELSFEIEGCELQLLSVSCKLVLLLYLINKVIPVSRVPSQFNNKNKFKTL